MRIILLQNVEDLGKKWEVKEVADGYARNFLIPRGFAKLATQNEIEEAERRRAEEEKRAKKELEAIEDIVSKLDGYELKISVAVGEEGQLYEGVNAQKISIRLKEEGFDVAPKQIQLKEAIKEPGEFAVTLELDHGLEAEIRVIVEAA